MMPLFEKCNRKKSLLAAAFFCLFVPLFCNSIDDSFDEQKVFSYLQEPGLLWQKVLPGAAVSKPAPLSFGFCVISDAKKLTCISYDGKILWEKSVSKPKKAGVFELSDDFILFTNEEASADDSSEIKNTITLINPSGIELWKLSVNCEVQTAFSGRDGRIFVLGKSTASCFGINGIKKWEKNLFQNDFSPDEEIFEDEDGFLYFARGIKLSPFGASESFIPDESKKLFPVIHKTEENQKLVRLKNQYIGRNFTEQNILYSFFDSEYHLILCKKDWNIEGYSIFTAENKKEFLQMINKAYAVSGEKKSRKVFTKSYLNFYNLNDIWGKLKEDVEISSSERTKVLSEGLYGEDEIKYASHALNLFNKYKNEINTQDFKAEISYSEFESNSRDFEKVLNQIPFFASTDFLEISGDYIVHTQNLTILKSTLRAVQKCGFDPEYKVLGAIQTRARSLNKKNEDVVVAMCDAIYEICRFMGKDAYFAKGKQILTDFLFTENTDRVKAYARKTFSRIKALEL